MVWDCDEKRGALRRKREGREEGLREDGRTEEGMISKRIDFRRWKCTIVLHGGVCHRTSTPLKSGNKMKRKTFDYA